MLVNMALMNDDWQEFGVLNLLFVGSDPIEVVCNGRGRLTRV